MLQPPIIKIYEAYSAVSDQRIQLFSKNALVTSSDGAKTYTVCFDEDQYTSNDNATIW